MGRKKGPTPKTTEPGSKTIALPPSVYAKLDKARHAHEPFWATILRLIEKA